MAIFLAACWLAPAATAIASPSGNGSVSIESPIGPIEYHPGRGLRVGDTGLVLGGFATAETERLEEGESRAGLEGVNFFLSYDPAPFVRLFTELEMGGLVEWEDGRGIESEPAVEVERLYVDGGASDAMNLRLGKFLTPVGRWNLAPAEPLVWTTSEPLIVEEVFDDVTTGAMLWGSVFPRGGALSYSVYGTFLDPIAPERGSPPAEHGAGTHLEWASLAGWSLGASYLASESPGGGWNHLGGFDARWRPSGRLEITGEALFGEGTREEGALWGLYAQAVVETVPTLYAVARYERFDPPGGGGGAHLFDVGLAWVPVDSLRLKADYLFADHSEEPAEPGFRSSLSLLF